MSPWLSDLFLSSQSDERLASLASGGHERAFAVIVERYRRELHVFARRLRSDGRAEDIVQQTFLSAFSALRAGAEVTHLRGWLYQILRNASISASKRPSVEAELEDGMIASEPLEDTVERRMLARAVLAEVAGLPGRQRDAVVATALHGRSREAVATSMGVSEGAVRQLMHRARATLRTSVTALTPWPLARWLATARTSSAGDRLSEIAAGAGTASVGGVAVKLGAVVASGVVATGLVSTQLQVHHASHRAGPAVPSAHSSAPAGGGSGGAAARTPAAVGLAFVPTSISEPRPPRASGPGGEGSRPGSGDHSAATEGGGSPGGSDGHDGSGTSSGGSGGGIGSGGGSDGGSNGGPSASTSGSGNDGGGATASTGSGGGTQPTTPSPSTSGSHDGGSSSGSGSTATTSGSSDGGGTPVLSLSGDSGSSSVSGSGGGPGPSTTSDSGSHGG